MIHFLLFLLVFVGYNQSILALDYPDNLDSTISTYRFDNQLEEALIYLDAIAAKAQEEYGNQSDTFAFYLHYQANIIKELGRYQDALEQFEKVVTIYETNYTKKHIKLVPALLDLADTHIQLGNAQVARKTLSRALNITEQSQPSDFITLATIYNHFSAICHKADIHVEGLEWGQKALAIHSRAAARDTKVLIKSLDNIAICYNGMEQYEDAVIIQKQALELQQQLYPVDSSEIANLLNNLANFYSDMGRLHEALPYYLRAVDIIRKNKGNKHPETAGYLNNLAASYKRLGQLDLAQPLLLEALDICETTLGEKHPHTIICINNLGGVYYDMQAFEQANASYRKVVDLGEEVLGKEHPYYLTFKSSLASSYQQLNNGKKALRLFEEIVETSKIVHGPSSISVIKTYNKIAQCYLLLGPDFYDQALEYVKRSITMNALEPIELSQLGNNLAALSTPTFKSNEQFQVALTILSEVQQAMYQNTGDRHFLQASYQTQKALAYFLQQLSNTVYTRKDKLKSLSYMTNASSQAIALLKDLEDTGASNIVAEAITFAEYNKSVLLSSALQGNEAINFGEIPDSLKNRERTLNRERAAVKKKIIQANTAEDEEALKAANQELVTIQLEQDNLRQLLKDNYPKYNALKNEQKILTAAIIQEELLAPQSALLEYCVYDSAVYVIVITPSTVHLQELSIEKENLSSAVKRFRKSLSDYHFILESEQEAYVLYTQTAFDLYQVLIAPIRGHLANTKQLIIVPDNELGHIPFEALLSTFPNQQVVNYKNLDYLLHDYTISYSYAASLLLENKRHKGGQNNGKILGFAASYNPNDSIALHRSPSNKKLRQILDPLPAVTQEIEILQEQFPNSDFFFGKEANETQFKEQAANYSILHLAMHGIINHHYPLLSCLAFTEDYDPKENNFLEAHEISNMQLSNDLVVLSACKTGYGEFEQGEGILSLARSFMYAGAPSLVVSLWEINDLSTAAIMQLFYQNLAQGMSKDEALRQVKLEFIQKVDNFVAHPIFWSPFIVLGNTQPVHLNSPTVIAPWWIIGGSAVLTGLLFLLVRRRMRKRKFNELNA